MGLSTPRKKESIILSSVDEQIEQMPAVKIMADDFMVSMVPNGGMVGAPENSRKSGKVMGRKWKEAMGDLKA